MARVTLKSRLPAISVELQPRVSAQVKAGAEFVAELAREKVPRDTGALHDSIKVRRKEAAGYYVDVGDETAEYARPVEFGGGPENSHHPFLIPSLFESEDDIVRLVNAVLVGL